MDAGQLEQQLLSEEVKNEVYTGDGSVDFRGQPVLKSKTGTWKAFPYIFANELCERLAFYGATTNLVNYLTCKLHQGNVVAARNATTWSGTCYLTPLIGAFLADAYWGRYWTIAVFSTINLIGLCTLTLSASVPAFVPPECVGLVCPSATPAQHKILFTGLYLVALGAGGIKSCVSAFGADQFDDTDQTEKMGKKSFFNWFVFAISVGSLASCTVMVWIQENVGWGLGFGIPTVFMAISLSIFVCGTPLYRFQKPGGNPFTRICQVVVASVRNFKLDMPQDSSMLYETSDKTSAFKEIQKLEHTEQFKFLDKSAVLPDAEVSNANSEDCSNRWRLCTVTQVEELKILNRMFPIWATSIVCTAVHAQMSTMFVEQGNLMDGKVGSFLIPAASLSTFSVIGLLLCILIYDKFIICTARNSSSKGKGLSNLQKIGIGLFISILTMLVAALLEIKRLQLATKMGLVDKTSPIAMNISWQIPQYLLLGIAEAFFYIGKMDFFYNESPDTMQSLCSALSLLTTSMGNYLSSLVLTIVSAITTAGGQPGWIPDNLNQGQLYNYFFLWAAITFLNLLVFISCAMKYKHKKTS